MKTLANSQETVAYCRHKVKKFYLQSQILKSLKILFMMQIFILLFLPFSSGQTPINIIDSVITAAYNEGKLNGNVLIAEKGQIVYNRSFGFGNEITQEKLNENSVFGLASVSKQFTAMAIAILKEQCKLNYDDKITKFLPELTAYDNITIRNLLTHTSGFPDFEQLMRSPTAMEYVTKHVSGNIIKNKDVVGYFSMYKPKFEFEPGTQSEYCDIGYVFLGSIIEMVSGLTYSEFLDKMIFKPLEMNNTFVLSPETTPDKIKDYALGYIYSETLHRYLCADSIIAQKSLQILTDGPAGIYSTVLDLLKWDRALYTEQLVSFSSLKEIFEPAVLSDNTRTSYGFGWFIRENPTYGKSVYHTGEDRGYITCIERNIDHDKTIIILENHNQGVFPVDIINRYLYNIPVPKEIILSTAQMQALCGTYEIQKDMDLRIWIDNNKLISQTGEQKILPLFAENELLLYAKDIDVKLQFEKNNQGQITHLNILLPGNKILCKKK